MSVPSDLRAVWKVIRNAVEVAGQPTSHRTPHRGGCGDRFRATSRSRSTSPIPASTCTRSASGTRRWPSWPRHTPSRSSPAAPVRASPCSTSRRSPSSTVVGSPTSRSSSSEQDLRIVFYVNQNQKNFQMFRYGRMWHVFINHGESDKMYMTTNQFKAYDYALVAGEAALDRLGRKLWDFDLAKKAIPIGRPQADHFAGELPYTPDERTVVLYAPTWEGDRPAAAYGSIASHGVALVDAVLASPPHRLIYRPHPRSGVIDPEYRAANARIIAAIAAANQRDPRPSTSSTTARTSAGSYRPPTSPITDISAMIYDRLATGKPIIVARPVESGCRGRRRGIPRLGRLAVRRSRRRHPRPRRPGACMMTTHARVLEYWAERHFGDTTPGAATAALPRRRRATDGGVGPPREDPRRGPPLERIRSARRRGRRRGPAGRATTSPAAGPRGAVVREAAAATAGTAAPCVGRRSATLAIEASGPRARGDFGGFGTASRANGKATGAGPKASCDDRTMLRPMRWLPPPPTTAPMPNGISRPTTEVPWVTANRRMNALRMRAAICLNAAFGRLEVTNSPQYAVRDCPCPRPARRTA